MDRQEREQIIEHYCHMAAKLRDQHRSTEEILQALRQAGAWQYQCFRAMRAIYGLSISEAKQLIDDSATFADQREKNMRLRKMVVEVLKAEARQDKGQ